MQKDTSFTRTRPVKYRSETKFSKFSAESTSRGPNLSAIWGPFFSNSIMVPNDFITNQPYQLRNCVCKLNVYIYIESSNHASFPFIGEIKPPI